MKKIIIADVLYTNTDETFYVLNREYQKASLYSAETVDAVIQNLEKDNWHTCGKIKNKHNQLADLLSNDDCDYIAVWEE